MWKLVVAAIAAGVVLLVLWAPQVPSIPGLGSLASLWNPEPPAPPLDERRFNVALARFDGDGWTESGARLVVGTFQEFPELSVVRLEHTIGHEKVLEQGALHEKAEQFLQRSGTDVVIWGGSRVRMAAVQGCR
jgi:hypothetical protein